MDCRLLLILGVLPLTTLLLQGCLGAALAAQAFPVVMGGGAIIGSEDRSPFAIKVPESTGEPKDETAALETKIRLAECGDAQSQYWLAGRLNNNFNAAPNYVEVYKWYRLAEMGGFTPASEQITGLYATMSATQVAEARSLADAWKPASESCPTQS